MQKPRDELLVAYLDGELDEARQAEIEAWLARDARARERLAELSEGDAVLRAAFDEILREEVPQRLIDAARGADLAQGAPRQGIVVPFPRPARSFAVNRRWVAGIAVAASLFGLLIGGGAGYFGITTAPEATVARQPAATELASNTNWLDNVAEFHKLFVSAASADSSFTDIPANENGGEVIQKISQRTAQQGLRVPNLKPWGLIFEGARLVAVDGKSAAQLVYKADNKTVGKAIGPLTVLVGPTARPDAGPAFVHRQDVNVLYWRRKGHLYAIAGQADSGYMWGLANDIAWQLDAS